MTSDTVQMQGIGDRFHRHSSELQWEYSFEINLSSQGYLSMKPKVCLENKLIFID